MQFTYIPEAKESNICLHVKEYNHIFKVRRVISGTTMECRNLVDDFIYTYEISEINKKEATLHLTSKKELNIKNSELHIGWSVVDIKVIEKYLAILNEIGIDKLSFVYADYSQKNYKIDEKRLERILINSCEQCGRSSMMTIEFLSSVDEFLNLYKNSAIIDFCENYLSEKEIIKSYLVGPEGGFSVRERELFKERKVFGLKSNFILKSQTAVVGVCSKLSL